jgi:hypothetical protein
MARGRWVDLRLEELEQEFDSHVAPILRRAGIGDRTTEWMPPETLRYVTLVTEETYLGLVGDLADYCKQARRSRDLRVDLHGYTPRQWAEGRNGIVLRFSAVRWVDPPKRPPFSTSDTPASADAILYG